MLVKDLKEDQNLTEIKVRVPTEVLKRNPYYKEGDILEGYIRSAWNKGAWVKKELADTKLNIIFLTSPSEILEFEVI